MFWPLTPVHWPRRFVLWPANTAYRWSGTGHFTTNPDYMWTRPTVKSLASQMCQIFITIWYPRYFLSAPAIPKQDFTLFKCIFFPFCLFPLQIPHIRVVILSFEIVHVATYTRGWIIPFHRSFLLICKGELDQALMPLPFNITWIYTRSFISPLIIAKISLLHEQPW